MDIILQAIVSGILVGGVYGLVSMGLSLIFGVMRIVNFAQGELVMLGMYVTFFCATILKLDPYLSIIISGPLLFLLGLLIQKFLISPIQGEDDTPQLLVTIGISMLIQNIVLLVFSADPRILDTSYSKTYYNVGWVMLNQAQIISFIIASVCTILITLILTRTDLGKALRATVDDREMAQMMGINTNRIYLFSFGLGAALAGIGGTALISFYPATPMVGGVFLVIAFVSVVMGGMGNIVGAYVATMIIGIVQQLSAVVISVDLQNVGVFIIFLLLLMFRPNGLFRKEVSL